MKQIYTWFIVCLMLALAVPLLAQQSVQSASSRHPGIKAPSSSRQAEPKSPTWVTRPQRNVPKVAPGTITLDGNISEPEWATGAHADLVTPVGYQMWASNYYRDVPQPEFTEYYARMLWTDDTLYVAVHIQEFVNDTTNLFFAGNSYTSGDPSHWASDQLFIGISNRLGLNTWGNYEGNPEAAPNGPYHLEIFGNKVTFNDNDTVWINADYWRDWESRWDYVPNGGAIDSRFPTGVRIDPWFDSTSMTMKYDTLHFGLFDAEKIARCAATWDTTTGVWDVELAIYNPSVRAQSSLGFNIGGSMSSRYSADTYGDSYGYYTWQPNVLDHPFEAPFPGWCAEYVQRNTDYWAILNFDAGPTDTIVRTVITVPKVPAGVMKLDGKLDEPMWLMGAQANLVTPLGYDMWANNYYRSVPQPEFDQYTARMLWTDDTLYLGIHIDEFVNDSTNLFFASKHFVSPSDTGDPNHWKGDQLFVGISSRLGLTNWGNYEGNPQGAPEGPYHFEVFGDQLTFNDNDTVWINTDYWHGWESRWDYVPNGGPLDPKVGTYGTRLDPYFDSTCMCVKYDTNHFGLFDASKIARCAATWDTTTGVWDVELAIYHPNVRAQSSIAMNLGGSMSSRHSFLNNGDSYGYYTWKPNTPDDPFTAPFPGWCAEYVQRDDTYWPKLNFTNVGTTTTVNGGWAMLSLPVQAYENRKAIHYPTASSAAFVFAGSYTIVDTLHPGIGYWMKFDGGQDLDVFGAPVLSDTLYLHTGWNMIGALSVSIPTSSIVSDPPGIVTSQFFGYNGIYEPATTLEPGRGYWVKVSEPGQFILSGILTSVQNRIKIVPTNELPPPPPSDNLAGVKPNVPKEFALSQNYPNPFNPTTRFVVDIPKASQVEVAVYNTLGQKVVTLMNGVTPAGSYPMEWNSKDSHNLAVPTGVYFVRMNAEKFTDVKKIMLMK